MQSLFHPGELGGVVKNRLTNYGVTDKTEGSNLHSVCIFKVYTCIIHETTLSAVAYIGTCIISSTPPPKKNNIFRIWSTRWWFQHVPTTQLKKTCHNLWESYPNRDENVCNHHLVNHDQLLGFVCLRCSEKNKQIFSKMVVLKDYGDLPLW